MSAITALHFKQKFRREDIANVRNKAKRKTLMWENFRSTGYKLLDRLKKTMKHQGRKVNHKLWFHNHKLWVTNHKLCFCNHKLWLTYLSASAIILNIEERKNIHANYHIPVLYVQKKRVWNKSSQPFSFTYLLCYFSARG